MNFRDWLNRYFGYKVDFNRVGNNFFSERHRYNNYELSQRSFITLSAAIFSFFAWNIKDSKQDAALGLMSGLLWAHAITMYPLVKKRYEAQSACSEFKAKLLKMYASEDLKNILPRVTKIMDDVMEYTGSASSSAIWSNRKQLMARLHAWSTDPSLADVLPQLLEQENIIELLKENTPVISKMTCNPC
ncbi:MAG: hypothetical protein Q8M03_11140 [Legionella sp.]|nr:hypothetical protein [Legionella sp.]